jgi:hypothetical protein
VADEVISGYKWFAIVVCLSHSCVYCHKWHFAAVQHFSLSQNPIHPSLQQTESPTAQTVYTHASRPVLVYERRRIIMQKNRLERRREVNIYTQPHALGMRNTQRSVSLYARTQLSKRSDIQIQEDAYAMAYDYLSLLYRAVPLSTPERH